jgi:hypothetical protein
MEAGLEGDLAEVHRLLSMTNSALVRDHLHTLLNDLMQRKHKLLVGGTGSAQHAAAQHAADGPPSGLRGGGSGGHAVSPAVDAKLLAAGFSRDLSLGGAQGGHEQAGGHGGSPVLRSTRSATDTGDTQSTKSGGTLGSTTPIEPIVSSSMMPSGNSQIDMSRQVSLSAFDPVWQPAGGRSESIPQQMDGFMSAQQLRHEVERHGLAASGLAGVNGFSSASFGQGAFSEAMPQHGSGGAGVGGSGSAMPAMQMHHGGSSQQQHRLPPQHLGIGATQHPWLAQQQAGGPTVTSAFSGAMLTGGLQPPPPPPYAGKALMQAMSSMNGYGGLLRARGAAGSGFGGLYGGGGGSVGPFGGGGSGSSFGPFSNLPFSTAMHPALQYGIDLRAGELDAMGLPLFRPLTTYSWEQSDGLVKIYVPLRGVQTELLRATFTPTSLEVRVVALQSKNYVYAVKSLYMPINSDACHVAASKTKKNVLITLQKMRSDTPEEKHWRDLTSN